MDATSLAFYESLLCSHHSFRVSSGLPTILREGCKTGRMAAKTGLIQTVLRIGRRTTAKCPSIRFSAVPINISKCVDIHWHQTSNNSLRRAEKPRAAIGKNQVSMLSGCSVSRLPLTPSDIIYSHTPILAAPRLSIVRDRRRSRVCACVVLRHMPAIMGTPNIMSVCGIQGARTISELCIQCFYFRHKIS